MSPWEDRGGPKPPWWRENFWRWKDPDANQPVLIQQKKREFREWQQAFCEQFYNLVSIQKNKREYSGCRTDAVIGTGFLIQTRTKEGHHPTYQRRMAAQKAYHILKDERTSRILREKGLVYVKGKWQHPRSERQQQEVALYREFAKKEISTKKGFVPSLAECAECPRCGFSWEL